jgi:hypothetical protein
VAHLEGRLRVLQPVALLLDVLLQAVVRQSAGAVESNQIESNHLH